MTPEMQDPTIQVTSPLRAVDLPGVDDLELRGLIVVIGPNSSGKTQFLQDLNDTVCGRRRTLVVATALAYRQPLAFTEYFGYLLNLGIIRESSPDHYLKRSLQYGADEGGGTLRKSAVQSQHEQFLRASQNKLTGTLVEQGYLRELGAFACSALFLKNRLSLMDACSTFNYISEGPSRTLQALYLNRKAKAALHAEISRVFQRALWVDNTRHGQLVMRVSELPHLPPAEERLEPEAMEGYRTIDTEGDGLRSYSAICATLLLEQRPLCLIDEPEMCLHPPQAHAMGRFIGEHASEQSCTLVATHSSHVLRGILETTSTAQVIRLTRRASTFRAKRLSPQLLSQATSKPRSRSEAILDGLLADGVVLCEAESDRIVYESAHRTLLTRRGDIRFIGSEGTGGFLDALRLYRALEVPCAIIADIDFMAKDGELRNALAELGTATADLEELGSRVRAAVGQIRSCISGRDNQAIAAELTELAQAARLLGDGDSSQLRRRIIQTAEQLYSLRELKLRGLSAIPPDTKTSDGLRLLAPMIEGLLGELRIKGLFLVPVGELESWLPVLMKGLSRDDKSRWAMLAAEKIEEVGKRDDDVWQFVSGVHEWLQPKVGNVASLAAKIEQM